MWRLKTIEKPGICFASLNPAVSLEIWIKTLNHLEMCGRHCKLGSIQNFIYFNKCHTVLSSNILQKQFIPVQNAAQTKNIQKLLSKLEHQMLLEILFGYEKVTTVFQRYSLKCAAHPLNTLEIHSFEAFGSPDYITFHIYTLMI